jgi:hypothetical protein
MADECPSLESILGKGFAFRERDNGFWTYLSQDKQIEIWDDRKGTFGMIIADGKNAISVTAEATKDAKPVIQRGKIEGSISSEQEKNFKLAEEKLKAYMAFAKTAKTTGPSPSCGM